MTAVRRVLLIIVAMLAVLLGTGSISPTAGAKDAAARVVVKGDVQLKLKLTVADLAAIQPQQSLTVTFLSGSTPQTHTYTGPRLIDVLNRAVPEFDPAIKNDNLRHFVAVTGSDGYKVVVAWGEFDPNFEAKNILLAVTEDGASLATAGPRLVVPGDSRGGRYVTNVVTVRLAPTD